MAKSGDRAGRGGTCTKRHFLLSKHSLPPAHQPSSTPNPLCCPAPPSSDGVRSPPSPRRLPTPGAKVGPQRDLGEKQAHTRPHSSPGRPCIVPGALRSPPRGSSSPAAPRRPRPAPPPPRSRYQGPTSGAEGPAAQGARGLDRRRGWETEEGVRGGRGRDGGGQAAPPFPAAAADRRAEGRSAPGPAAGVGASPGQGVRGVGAGSRVLTLRSCSQKAQCSLACD